MAKRSVQPNLFSFLPLKISDIHTNKVKRSRVDEKAGPDDSSSESEPEGLNWDSVGYICYGALIWASLYLCPTNCQLLATPLDQCGTNL